MKHLAFALYFCFLAGTVFAIDDVESRNIDGLFVAPFPKTPSQVQSNSETVRAYSYVDTDNFLVYTATYRKLDFNTTTEQLLAMFTRSAFDQNKLVDGRFEKDMFVSFFGYMRMDYSIVYTHQGIEYEKWATLQAYRGCMVNWSIQTPTQVAKVNVRKIFNKNAQKVECGHGI